jgi:hypothetical protein
VPSSSWRRGSEWLPLPLFPDALSDSPPSLSRYPRYVGVCVNLTHLMDQPMQEPLGANKFTVQTQGRCYETKNVWLAATGGNTYMAHRAGHHLWLMLMKLPGSGGGGGGNAGANAGGGSGADAMGEEEDDENLARFERKNSESTVDVGDESSRARELSDAEKKLIRINTERVNAMVDELNELEDGGMSEERTRILADMTRLEAENDAIRAGAKAGNTTAQGRAGGFFESLLGDDSSSAPLPTDDYWQWLPVITSGEKPSTKDLIGAGGVVGSVIHVGTLQRPLQGIDRPDRSYYQDAHYVAGLESSEEYVVAEQSLPCAEVVLC